MEIASAKWFSDMAQMEEDSSFFHQYSLDYTLDELSFQSVSTESYPRSTTSFNGCSAETLQPLVAESERPAKQLKSNSWKPSKPASSSSSSQIVSFGNSNSSQKSSGLHSTLKPKIEMNMNSSLVGHGSSENLQSLMKNEETKRPFGAVSRSPLLAQDHVLAERKRREKLSQRFIALSALIPGLKKMDKASVLGDAIKHVKQLQERLRELEEQATKKTMESVVLMKKAHLFTDDDSSSDENSNGFSDQNLPEIEARVSGKDVLIRIHSGKHDGLLIKILNEVEKLHLSIVHTSALKFGDSTLDITIIAKMEDEFCMTVKEMAKTLRKAVLNFISDII